MPRRKTRFETHLGYTLNLRKNALIETHQKFRKTRSIFGSNNPETVEAELIANNAQSNVHNAKWKWLALKLRLERNPEKVKEIAKQLTKEETHFKESTKREIKIKRKKHPAIRTLQEEIDALQEEIRHLNSSSIDAEKEGYVSRRELVERQIRATELSIKATKKHIEIEKIAKGDTEKIKSLKLTIRQDSEHIQKLRWHLNRLE